MRVLVTGGAGFIGSHVVEHFSDKAEVRVLDNLRTGSRHNLDRLRCEFIEGSILDRALVERAVAGVDYVFHLAAMISVPESMSQPRECVDLNVTGTLHVLEAAAAAGCKKIVLASSAAVYGDNPAMPKVESMTPEPMSPYAVTKLDGEYYLQIFQQQGRIESTSLRFFNVFGPRQDPRSAYAAAVPIFLDRALSGQPLGVYGDGEQTRDFIYVKDIVEALVFAATTPGLRGSYNVGYGQRMTINDLTREILRLTGSRSEVVHLPERPGEIKHSMASADRLRAAGWRPRHTLAQGLLDTVQAAKTARQSR